MLGKWDPQREYQEKVRAKLQGISESEAERIKEYEDVIYSRKNTFTNRI